MMRDSPLELARLLAGPYASIRITRTPARCRKYAVQAPKTPAPIMATEYLVSFVCMVATETIMRVVCRIQQYLMRQAGASRSRARAVSCERLAPPWRLTAMANSAGRDKPCPCNSNDV